MPHLLGFLFFLVKSLRVAFFFFGEIITGSMDASSEAMCIVGRGNLISVSEVSCPFTLPLRVDREVVKFAVARFIDVIGD